MSLLTRLLTRSYGTCMPRDIALCTTSQVAAFYKVDSSTVRRWVEKGLLKPYITTPGGQYRFDQSALERNSTPSNQDAA